MTWGLMALLVLGFAAAAIWTIAAAFNLVVEAAQTVSAGAGEATAGFKRFAYSRLGRRDIQRYQLHVPDWLRASDWRYATQDDVRVTLEEFDPSIDPPAPLPPPLKPRLPKPIVHQMTNTTAIAAGEIETLWRIAEPTQPYRFVDLDNNPRARVFGTAAVREVPALPPVPAMISLPTDLPTLTLPLYQGSGKWALGWVEEAVRKRLNEIVRAAHADVIAGWETCRNAAEGEIAAIAELNEKRKVAHASAVARWKEAKALRDDLARQRARRFEEVLIAARAANDEYIAQLRLFTDDLKRHGREAVEQYYANILSRLPLPKAFPRDVTARYDPESRILIVDHAVPDVERLRITHSVELKSRIDERAVPKRDHKRLQTLLVEGLALNLAIGMSRVDPSDCVSAVAVNLQLRHLDKRTGRERETCIASLYATKEQLAAIEPDKVDVHLCYRSLRGKYIPGVEEYEAVEPIIRMNMDDDRIVPPRAVMGGMSADDNLASMDWGDFEQLVRELFEREFGRNGAKVEITRASRDRGVDAIVFDPDPIRGGKYVIQAKRYTIGVDVAAVRELYGTVVNEGAMKGVLVTTASFGPDAYAFAKDKPLTLVPGPELLGLLKKHGFTFRIDIAEARRQLK